MDDNFIKIIRVIRTPISESQTFLDHLDSHNLLENGFLGQK